MSEDNSGPLVQLNTTWQGLAASTSVPAVKEFRDKASAIEVWLREQRAGFELQNYVAEHKIRAERRLGELIPLHIHRGGSPKSHDVTLADLGVEPMQSHRWQTVARLALEVFEGYLAETKAAGGELTTADVLRLASRQELRAHRGTPAPVETPSFPEERYRCLVIDPPWPMDKSERTERPTQGNHLPYPVMSLDDIIALPVPGLADPEGCHVYLWVTHRFLPDGFRCFEAWGVHYHCLLTWVKPTGMTPFSWMFNTEHVLFGWIGHLPLMTMGQKVSFEAQVTEHSAKPEIFYDVVRAVSPAPRLDLFARADHDAFSRWGHEVRA